MDNLFIRIIRQSDGQKFEIGSGYDWVVADKGLSGFGDVSNDIDFEDNATSDGGIITSEHLSKKDRSIEAVYKPQTNRAVARKKAISFFKAREFYKVCVTWGMNTVFAIGKIYKMKCPEVPLDHSLTLDVTFLFPNPYWSSMDDFGKNIASLRGMLGFPYLCSITDGTPKGVTGGLFNFAQEVTLNNDGDAPTRCKVTILCQGGTCENPKILINDEYVRVLDTLADGESIEMDFTAQPPTIKKGGINFVGHCDRTSAFQKMILARGDNKIAYDADNGSSHMNVTVYYNKQYEAI